MLREREQRDEQMGASCFQFLDAHKQRELLPNSSVGKEISKQADGRHCVQPQKVLQPDRLLRGNACMLRFTFPQ